MLRFRSSRIAAALAVAGVVGLAFACKSSPTGNNCNTNGPTAPSLVGNYTLVSFRQGSTTLTAPTVSGTLSFTATRYNAVVNLPGGSGTIVTVADSGTYQIIGSSCINEYTEVTGNPQFSGSFTLANSTLSVSGQAGGQIVESVWTQQP